MNVLNDIDMKELDIFIKLPLRVIVNQSEKVDYEICGIWDVNSHIQFMHNFADDKENEFTFTPYIWNEIENDQKNTKRIKGIFHSHPKEIHGSKLSISDIQMARNTNLDILCYSKSTGSFDYYSPLIPHPYPGALIGFKFKEEYTFYDYLDNIYRWFTGHHYYLGRSDCYSIVKDFYKLHDIELNDFFRTEEDIDKPLWWNRFEEEFESCGFQICDKFNGLQTGDVLLIHLLNSKYPTHIGVCIVNKDNNDVLVLHQPGGTRRSEIIQYKTVKNIIGGVLRHSYNKAFSNETGFIL